MFGEQRLALRNYSCFSPKEGYCKAISTHCYNQRDQEAQEIDIPDVVMIQAESVIHCYRTHKVRYSLLLFINDFSCLRPVLSEKKPPKPELHSLHLMRSAKVY